MKVIREKRWVEADKSIAKEGEREEKKQVKGCKTKKITRLLDE